MHPLAAQAAALLGTNVARAGAMSGGYVSSVLRLTLTDGREAVAKASPAPAREAAMLRAIAATGAPAPTVLATSSDALVMTLAPDDGDLARAWGDLGRVLTRLHASVEPNAEPPETNPKAHDATRPAAPYGWPDDDAFGPLAIPNAPLPDWPAFWGERRLLAHVERLPADLAKRVAALAGELPERLPTRPPAALLHGDLWVGNVLTRAGRVSALIDPACLRGHAEADLAMLTLFGTPSAAFWDAYPVDPGWRERRPVYQLWPAIVHLLLFGEGYRPMVSRLLDEAKRSPKSRSK